MSADQRANVAYWAAIAIAFALLFTSGVTEHREATIGHSDFSYIWAGPRTILDGGDPYDAASWSASVDRLGTEPFDDPRVYSYPPYVAVALLPLGTLPLSVAAGLWTCGTLAAAVVALWLLLRAVVPGAPIIHALAAATLLLSEPAVVSFYSGQWSFLILAAVALGVATERRWPRAGGLAVLTAKPQIGLTVVTGFALRAVRRREFASAVAMIVPWTVVVGITALLASRWSFDWLSDVPTTRSAEPNVTTLAAAFGPFVAVLVALLTLATAVLADPGRRETLALWITAALVVAPYARSYEHLLLLVPIVLVSPGRRPLAVGALVSLLVVPWLLFVVVAPALRSESILVVVPLAIFGLVASASRLRPTTVFAES